MTLVVDAVRGEQAVLVADTKATFGVRDGAVDERERPPEGYASVLDANRAEYKNSVSKIVILDRHLAVGYAGDDPITKIKHLVGLRGRSAEQVLDELATVPDAHYVVLADGESSRLWQVRHDEVDERTTRPVGRGLEMKTPTASFSGSGVGGPSRWTSSSLRRPRCSSPSRSGPTNL